MLTLAKICEAILPIAYCAAAALYGVLFARRETPAQRLARPALIVALLIHSTLIYARTSYHGHCLVYTPFELLTLISFTITLTYLTVELTSRSQATGVFFIGTALAFDTVSVILSPSEITGVAPVLLNIRVGLHISASLIGYTAFVISAIYGGLYLMLYHQIKSNRFGTFYSRLPSLGLLQNMGEKSAIVGLIFLAAGIIIAALYLPNLLPNFRFGDPKFITTVAVWWVYAGALAARHIVKLNERTVVILSLVGFVGAILSMTVLNIAFSSFHNFQ